MILVGTKIDLRNDQKTIAELAKEGKQPITPEQGMQQIFIFTPILEQQIFKSPLLVSDAITGAEKAKEINALKYLECSAYTREGMSFFFFFFFCRSSPLLMPPRSQERLR
jgi:GTPase SAR1 family protein